MVRYKILRGLGRLGGQRRRGARSRAPGDGDRAHAGGASSASLHWRSVLEARRRDGSGARARRATSCWCSCCATRRCRRCERLLPAAGAAVPRRGLRATSTAGCARATRALRAGSRELLENLLRPPLREPILALVDEAADAERLAGAGELYAARPLGYEAVLERMLDEGGETLRCIAAYHVGELGLQCAAAAARRALARDDRLLPVAGARAHARARSADEPEDVRA